MPAHSLNYPTRFGRSDNEMKGGNYLTFFVRSLSFSDDGTGSVFGDSFSLFELVDDSSWYRPSAGKPTRQDVEDFLIIEITLIEEEIRNWLKEMFLFTTTYIW